LLEIIIYRVLIWVFYREMEVNPRITFTIYNFSCTFVF